VAVGIRFKFKVLLSEDGFALILAGLMMMIFGAGQKKKEEKCYTICGGG
jgi:hypothetical protein